MPPLIDIYLFCAIVGSIYIVGSAALGFANAADAGSADGGDLSGADAGGDGGDLSGADAGGDGGDLSGADAGDGGDLGGADASRLIRANVGQYGMQTRKKRVNISILILKILSPSTITAFMAFFGLAGYLLLHYIPALGGITLLPAIACGVIGYQVMTAMVGFVAAKMHTSGSFKEAQVIGRIAEVTVPIPCNGMGELTYTVSGGRETAPARSADTTKTIATGSRVVVTDVRDGIYLVTELGADEEILQLESR